MRRRLIYSLLASSFIGGGAPAIAETYTLTPATSTIAFQGTHAENPFQGTFRQWSAEVTWLPENLTASRISATIVTGSANTGNAMYDGTLPTADWFNTAQFPTATFQSTRITSTTTAGTYRAEGTLTVRGQTHAVTLPFTVTPAANGVQATATLPLNRLTLGLGQQSDPKAEWVGPTISLTFTLHGTKAR